MGGLSFPTDFFVILSVISILVQNVSQTELVFQRKKACALNSTTVQHDNLNLSLWFGDFRPIRFSVTSETRTHSVKQ